MEKKDILFFKIIASVICLVICIGIGGYFIINHESDSKKRTRLINDMEQNQKDIDNLEKKLK